MLAVGRHTRLPRAPTEAGTSGGGSIGWAPWTRPSTRCETRERALREPSLQLAGRRDRGELNLATLRHNGVRLAGHLTGIAGEHGPLRQRPRRDDGREPRRACVACWPASMPPSQAQRTVLRDAESSSRTWRRSARSESLRRPARLDLAARAASAPWSGPPAFVARTTGCGRPWSTPPARCATTTGSPRFQGCTSSASASSSRRRSSLIDGARHDAELLADHIATRCARHQLAV